MVYASYKVYCLLRSLLILYSPDTLLADILLAIRK